jgi:membrane-bound lytic murein transglycosylase F
LRVISAVVISALLGSCAPKTPLLDQIRSQGELRVITRNAPTTYYIGASEQRAAGIEFDLAQAFADHLGVRLSLMTADTVWQLVPSVIAGEAHIAAAGLAITDARREVVSFGPAYQSVDAHVIYRMGEDRPESIDDLIGAALEVRSGTYHVAMLNEARSRSPDLGWAENRATSAEALLRRVAAGTIDYAIVNSNEFNLLRHYYPEVQIAFDLKSENPLAWALQHSADDLREEVSRFFARMQATGELAWPAALR